MTNLAIKNENRGNEFFSKNKMIRKFPESNGTIHKRFTLVTGTNNDLKRALVKSMYVDSCNKTNSTIFIDTRRILDNNDISLLASHYIMGEKLRNNNVYEDGMPINLFSL